MKKFYSILAAALFLTAAIPTAKAAFQVSVDFFHDNLDPYGDWREVGDYGYVWQPRDVDRDWRPYSDGRWLYTDAGWIWDSDEPYSWAVYHYGRWARVDRVGWVWVPGTEWGPGWVSWRRSSRHVGWAPLPPEARFSRSSGFSARVDFDFDIGPMNYSFVEVRNFGAPRLRAVFVEPQQNITIINQTTNITRITYVNNVVYNEGPQYDAISRESAQPIRRLKLERREALDGDPRAVRAEQLMSRVEGDSLRVVAPSFDTKPATAPRKVAAKIERVEVDRGWKNAGPPKDVAKLRTKIQSEPATPAEPPPVPPVALPVAEEKPVKGKVKHGAKPTNPAPPAATEAAPPSPEKPTAPVATEAAPPPNKMPAQPATTEAAPPSREKPSASDQLAKPGKPAKGAKPVKPEAITPRTAPSTAEMTEPSGQSNKGKNKGSAKPRPPVEPLPQAKVQERKPKSESVEPKRKLPPAVIENNPSQAKKPALRLQAPPTVTQPQPTQPAKGKGKGKGKGEKEDALLPEGAL